MATFNSPVATVLLDDDYTVVLRVTGQYTAAANAANTKIFTANSSRFANASRLCLVDVVSIQYSMGLANGFVSLEYSNPTGNTTIAAFGKRESGEHYGYMANPTGANTLANAASSTGDVNLLNSALDANDTFNLIITMRKNDYNGAYANVGIAYDHS